MNSLALLLLCWLPAPYQEPAPPARTVEPITYSELLDWMVDLDRLWVPPREGERCVQ